MNLQCLIVCQFQTTCSGRRDRSYQSTVMHKWSEIILLIGLITLRSETGSSIDRLASWSLSYESLNHWRYAQVCSAGATGILRRGAYIFRHRFHARMRTRWRGQCIKWTSELTREESCSGRSEEFYKILDFLIRATESSVFQSFNNYASVI